MDDPTDFSDVPRNSSVTYSISRTKDGRGNVVQEDYSYSKGNAKRDTDWKMNSQQKTKMHDFSFFNKKTKSYADKQSLINGIGKQDNGLSEKLLRNPKMDFPVLSKKPKKIIAVPSLTKVEANDKQDNDKQRPIKVDPTDFSDVPKSSSVTYSATATKDARGNVVQDYSVIRGNNERDSGFEEEMKRKSKVDNLPDFRKSLKNCAADPLVAGERTSRPYRNIGMNMDARERFMKVDPTDFSNAPKNFSETFSATKDGRGNVVKDHFVIHGNNERDCGMGECVQRKSKVDDLPHSSKTNGRRAADSTAYGNRIDTSQGYQELNIGRDQDSKGRFAMADPTDFSNMPKKLLRHIFCN